MTEDERAAREWLEDWKGSRSAASAKYAATILRLLDRPVCPRGSEVPNDVLDKMFDAYRPVAKVRAAMRAAVDVLHAHLTAPPEPKKVEAWAIVDATGVRATASTLRDAEYLAHIHGGSRLIRLVEADDADA